MNVKIMGKSYYQCPGRTMRKDELENKQAKERASKVADFRSSRMGEMAASEDHGMGSTSYASGFAASQNPRNIEHKGGKDAIEKGLSASHTGDSLFQHSTLKSPPDIDLPLISKGGDGKSKFQLKQMSKSRVPIRPARDQVISSQQDMNSKLVMLDILPSQKVEIKEEEAPIESSFQPTTLSPRGGVGFTNLTSDWPFADSMYKTQYAGAARHLSSLGS